MNPEPIRLLVLSMLLCSGLALSAQAADPRASRPVDRHHHRRRQDVPDIELHVARRCGCDERRCQGRQGVPGDAHSARSLEDYRRQGRWRPGRLHRHLRRPAFTYKSPRRIMATTPKAPTGTGGKTEGNAWAPASDEELAQQIALLAALMHPDATSSACNWRKTTGTNWFGVTIVSPVCAPTIVILPVVKSVNPSDMSPLVECSHTDCPTAIAPEL